jgi:hypothetical protein
MYSQPDFVAVESLLEIHAHARGFEADDKRNILAALEMVSLDKMCR